MSADELSQQIRLLVDHLRGQRGENVTLSDVASVTEVLIATMRTYFKGIDTQIYRECRTLADYIENARKEIAALQPEDLESARIPRAGMELEAIVQHTETATNTIMECAEAIMNADTSDPDHYQATVQDKAMQIVEACSFQDITGQRISKVVHTLSYVEERLDELRRLLGVTEEDVQSAKAEHAEGAGEPDRGTHGPALEGEGIQQDDVDALFENAGDGESAAETGSQWEPDSFEGEVPSSSESSDASSGEAEGEHTGPDDQDTEESAQTDAPKSPSQDEIDALFG